MSSSEIFQTIISALGALALLTINSMKKSVDEATKSINELNTKVGVIIEKTERHDEELKEMRTKREIDAEEARVRHDAVREKFHELGNEINRIKTKSFE